MLCRFRVIRFIQRYPGLQVALVSKFSTSSTKSSLQATGRSALPARQTGENRRSSFFPARSRSRRACARPSAGTDGVPAALGPESSPMSGPPLWGPLACAAPPWTWARKAGSAAGLLVVGSRPKKELGGPCGHWQSELDSESLERWTRFSCTRALQAQCRSQTLPI